eukprot:GHVS01108190.1.p1 GENE.GHVS01108190.1~~GHVS01108190.1.p1  ORF type:complete len:468 (+),score=86.50 GHVS01108190.1:1047-2450(+)
MHKQSPPCMSSVPVLKPSVCTMSSSSSASAINMVSAVEEYIRCFLDSVPGMKALLLDADTTSVISLCFSQSQLLLKEVFLVERIDAASPATTTSSTKLRHLNVICFLRPTPDNLLRLTKELKAPRFHEYHLFFSNALPHTQLDRLARCDQHEVVRHVHEIFADILPLAPHLFSLNLPSTAPLLQDPAIWSTYEDSLFARMLDGLFAAICTARAAPVAVRHQAGSALCAKLASAVWRRLGDEQSLFGDIEKKDGSSSCVLLILDRRDDPLTPLLNQWTYQAMLHELVGINNNRVDLKKASEEEIVMSPTQDTFYMENLMANFGELGISVKQYVDMYQQESKTKAQVESIEDMQKFVDQYPEFRKLSGNVSKHVGVIHELSRLVERDGLLEVSSVEQELACHSDREEHARAVMATLTSQRIPPMEKLRLVLLFALRYEHDASLREQKEQLRKSGVEEEQVLCTPQKTCS